MQTRATQPGQPAVRRGWAGGRDRAGGGGAGAVPGLGRLRKVRSLDCGTGEQNHKASCYYMK